MNSNIRYYASDAFRYYAQQGKPTVGVIMLGSYSVGECADLIAVKQTIDYYTERNDTDVLTALDIVYMSDAGRKPKKNDIDLQIRKAAVKLYMDDRTVFRLLAKARERFANYRGLRVER